MPKATAHKSSKAVLVTTKYRLVIFGYIKDDKKLPAEITITGARNCIYWDKCGGFLGLAATGPNSNCRIGARIDEIKIYEITSVTPVSEGAEKAWEKAATYGVA